MRTHETAALAAQDGRVRGYACTFHALDLARDRVLPGAFRASLARRPARDVRMLFAHDPARPIGRWTRIVEDAHGLWVEGRIALAAASARDVAALLAAGALDGLSIGFRTVRARREAGTGIRNIAVVELHEISLVTFPMNARARVIPNPRST